MTSCIGKLFHGTALGLALSITAQGAAQVRTAPAVSQPATLENWARTVRPAERGAPNVIVILTDDVGFGAASTFGGPVPTPTLQALANRGLRYNRFHVTAVCGATRAALLTGRNQNNVNMAVVPELPAAPDGYNTIIPKSAGTIAQLLRHNGYSTALIGKANVTPMWETGPAGPFDRWPTGLGFDYYYGFMTAETDEYSPPLYENTRPVDPPAQPDYILDRDLADHAIGWLREQHELGSQRPFFLYYATGSTHAPLQAPADWIAKFRGQFDQGWDKLREETLRRQIATGIVPRGTRLAPRAPGIPAWDSIAPEDRKLYARQMEVYAGMLAFSDHQIGRVLDAVRAMGQEDNTLVVFIEGDNGASGEGSLTGVINAWNPVNGIAEDAAENRRRIDEWGGPDTQPHYAAGWAVAMNTPFPWMKQYASHLGATRAGMVLSWPKRIAAKGEIRTQYTHVIDVLPTILAAANIQPPESLDGERQQKLDGLDMSYSFDAPKAPSERRVQYYNLLDNAGIYKDGWLASTTPNSVPWNFMMQKSVPFASRNWELYDLDRDFSQSTDLARRYPAKLEEMKALYREEAARNHVLPGFNPTTTFLWEKNHAAPSSTTFGGPVSRLPWGMAPDVLNRSFTIQAHVSVSAPEPDGALVTQGGRFGGYCLCVERGLPTFVYNAGGAGLYQISSTAPLSPGAHQIDAAFDYDGGGRGKGGTVTLEIDGRIVATGRVEHTIPIMFALDEDFNIGRDSGTTVKAGYALPFTFKGDIASVTIQLGQQFESERTKAERAMSGD
ncbi:sulfatase [Rhizorhabdus wittichii RW1]|uniref:Sulfatase n=1 Tax=Rhizorhabdus wittichii (strain DSM 6014 / CCUG 31198 / JCM 15750 / NBRC 105917 / EY 4224 / RW1) TaxID=392499 RepID=A0A9J9HAV6_RHIWR|nr:sulfatase [Rhizorhabdus wittichii RW1]